MHASGEHARLAGTVTEICPPLVTAGLAGSDLEFGSASSVFSCIFKKLRRVSSPLSALIARLDVQRQQAAGGQFANDHAIAPPIKHQARRGREAIRQHDRGRVRFGEELNPPWTRHGKGQVVLERQIAQVTT